MKGFLIKIAHLRCSAPHPVKIADLSGSIEGIGKVHQSRGKLLCIVEYPPMVIGRADAEGGIGGGAGGLVTVGNGYEGVIGKINEILVERLGFEQSEAGFLLKVGEGGGGEGVEECQRAVGTTLHQRIGGAQQCLALPRSPRRAPPQQRCSDHKQEDVESGAHQSEGFQITNIRL